MFFYVNMWITDPEVDSRLSGHVLRPLCSPVEYQTTDFWEMTSGIIYVFSTLRFDSEYMSVSVFEAGIAGDIAPRAVLSSSLADS